MRILLTGRSGFIGRHLHTALVAAGHHVIPIARRAGVDMNQLLTPDTWLAYLAKVDVVINSVGIITETDIFNSFVEIMGLKEGKTRFTFSVSDQVGVLHEITGVFKDLNINISSLASYTTDEGPGELVIRFNAQDTGELIQKLTAIGYPPQHTVQIG